jgi:hypothetical protein
MFMLILQQSLNNENNPLDQKRCTHVSNELLFSTEPIWLTDATNLCELSTQQLTAKYTIYVTQGSNYFYTILSSSEHL